MKKTILLTAVLGLGLGSLTAQTVPLFINYQGKVTASDGTGLGTGTPVNRKVIFRIYDAPTAGTKIWGEQQTVTLSNGEFSVLLGQGIALEFDPVPVTPRPALDTVFTSGSAARYLEITVDNGDNTLTAADAPITPRQQITTTAYSFRARSADTIATGNDLQLNNSANYGLGYYGTGRLFNGRAVDGPVLYGNAGGALGSNVNGTQNIALQWNAAGNVGIGVAIPTGKLDVAGGVKATGTDGFTFNTGDADGGLFSPGDGIVTIRTNGSERLRVDAFGNTSVTGNMAALGTLSIGTSSLSTVLGYPSSWKGFYSTSTVEGLGIIEGTTVARLHLRAASGTANTTQDFIMQNEANSIQLKWLGAGLGNRVDIMNIDANGNVGIGATTPGARLNVLGSAATSSSNGDGDLIVGNRSGAHLSFQGGTGSSGLQMIAAYNNNTQSTLFLNYWGGGSIYLTGGDAAAKVSVGTSDMSEKFNVAGNAKVSGNVRTNGDLICLDNAALGIRWMSSDASTLRANIFRWSIDNRLYFTNNGGSNLTGVYIASGGTSITSTSDERLKSKIEPLTGLLEKIKTIRVVGFDMASQSVDAATGKPVVEKSHTPRKTKDGKIIKDQIGTIAQDWIKDFPELLVEPETKEGYYGLNYDRVGVVALGAVKELHQIVLQKNTEIESLKNQNTALAEKVATLEARDKAVEVRFAELEKQIKSATKATSLQILQPTGGTAE